MSNQEQKLSAKFKVPFVKISFWEMIVTLACDSIFRVCMSLTSFCLADNPEKCGPQSLNKIVNSSAVLKIMEHSCIHRQGHLSLRIIIRNFSIFKEEPYNI